MHATATTNTRQDGASAKQVTHAIHGTRVLSADCALRESQTFCCVKYQGCIPILTVEIPIGGVHLCPDVGAWQLCHQEIAPALVLPTGHRRSNKDSQKHFWKTDEIAQRIQ